MTRTREKTESETFLDYMANPKNRSDTPASLLKSRPRDSASLIILDHSRKIPKVLMGRRHQNHRFMPGVFVFPGGAIEPADRRMPVVGALSARTDEALAKQVASPSPTRGRALALAAIRETYEETGLMLGTKDYGAPEAPEGSIWKKFEESSVYPDIEELSFIARAITPPGRSKRFDTRFFVTNKKTIVEHQEGFIGPDSELTELVWVPLNKAERLHVPMITRAIIQELQHRIAAGFSELLPIPFYHVQHRRALRELL